MQVRFSRHAGGFDSPTDVRARPRPAIRPAIRLACLCLGLLSGGWAAASAAEPLDTSRLPQVVGAKSIYASPATTIYAAPDPVPQTADEVQKALAGEGWQVYQPPNANQVSAADQRALTFKKGPQALSVLVATPPGGAKTANVNYAAAPIANDLPFPTDASKIEFDPQASYLSCVSAQPVDALRAFFARELAALGWTMAPTARQSATSAFFVHADRAPLLLVLQKNDEGTTNVELKSVPPERLAAASQPAKPAAAEPAPAATPTAAPESSADKDDLGASIAKLAAQATADAIADAKAPPPSPADAPAETLRPRAGDDASIPLPETAEDVDFNGEDGKLEFTIASSVKAVAAFYRAAMAPLGWKETPSVINRPNMVELDFSKADAKVSLNIMQMGKTVDVTGDGDGLKTAAAKPTDATAAGAPAAPKDLEADETDGLPVPKDHTKSENDDTPFRHALTATVSADVASVLAFYRRELGKLGWKEQAPAATAPDQATVSYLVPDGSAVLKLTHSDDGTEVSLVERDRAKAEKAGLAPKPGQVKLMFGNGMDVEAIVTINKKSIKVAAGAGSKGSDGPTLDLPPGHYKIAAKVAGHAAMSEEADVGADETWGFLIGPGGVLPLQMY